MVLLQGLPEVKFTLPTNNNVTLVEIEQEYIKTVLFCSRANTSRYFIYPPMLYAYPRREI